VKKKGAEEGSKKRKRCRIPQIRSFGGGQHKGGNVGTVPPESPKTANEKKRSVGGQQTRERGRLSDPCGLSFRVGPGGKGGKADKKKRKKRGGVDQSKRGV